VHVAWIPLKVSLAYLLNMHSLVCVHYQNSAQVYLIRLIFHKIC